MFFQKRYNCQLVFGQNQRPYRDTIPIPVPQPTLRPTIFKPGFPPDEPFGHPKTPAESQIFGSEQICCDGAIGETVGFRVGGVIMISFGGLGLFLFRRFYKQKNDIDKQKIDNSFTFLDRFEPFWHNNFFYH